ncbi:MAG: hypothetical protein LQ342_002950 [Letrouitia transgressa]|nr:MAG: hypothetical protein LQ342_002950 [Letrouitia transgressa]
MTPAEVIEQVEELTDIELAILLSLVARENCVIIQTAEVILRSLQDELQCIARNVFRLSHVVIECDASTTLDTFSTGLLVEEESYDNGGDEIEVGQSLFV